VSVYSSHIQNVDLLNTNTGNFSLRWEAKNNNHDNNNNLEFCITLVDTTLINAWVMYRQLCAKKEASALNLKGFRIDFAKSLFKLRLQLAQRRTIEFWHKWRTTRTLSIFSYHKVCSNIPRWSLAFMEGQENSMQTFRSNRVHMFHLKNVNWILASKGRKIVCKFSFQSSVDTGK
jgi:hypothetical protein